ncbi:hypothetical protein C0Q70_15619 [Pomacea canaliculata]|uniref:Uncharacterized protein n=1 Tax=Pomacea canaliculata TaxID=400727 RepID=A0A2T7NVC6_POMCA|nr:hypothetical protein C0Q70_15619 [Pomacea canaliculata]
MAAVASTAFLCILTSLPALYTMSLVANVTADHAVSSSSAPGVGGLEMRKLRQIEAELEVLRRTVTELKAGAQCGSQSPQSSPQSEELKEVTAEIQGLRSQFRALQMQRELSALRSEILLAQSAMLPDTGSRRSAMPEDDASQPGSESAGRRVEDGNERPGVTRNIPSTLSTGVIGGSSHGHTGAAANALCLPLNPVLENSPGLSANAVIYGAEFEVQPLPQQDNDPRCAVCRAPRTSVVMLPAASSCHPGWTLEYSGYIMAGHHTHPAATEFLCVDKEQHMRIGSDKNDNGFLLYYVTAVCGSLPCPPYVSGKVFPCVVCSK